MIRRIKRNIRERRTGSRVPMATLGRRMRKKWYRMGIPAPQVKALWAKAVYEASQ